MKWPEVVCLFLLFEELLVSFVERFCWYTLVNAISFPWRRAHLCAAPRPGGACATTFEVLQPSENTCFTW